jgi:hypothetical protein
MTIPFALLILPPSSLMGACCANPKAASATRQGARRGGLSRRGTLNGYSLIVLLNPFAQPGDFFALA